MGNRTKLRVLSAVMALLISLTLALPVYAESTSGGLDEPASTVLPSDSEPGEGLEGSPGDGTEAPDGDDAADPGEAPGDSPSENPAPPPADDPAPPDADDTLQAEAASKPVQLVGNGGLAALTDEMRAGKRQLAASDAAGQLSRLVPDFHYVNHEVVYTTASKAEAELVAESYNGLLTSYEEGVAVIKVPADTLDVIEAAQDTANTYPPVYPNLVYVLDNSTLFSDSSIADSLPGEDASEDETPPAAGPDDSTPPADSIATPSGANPEPVDPPVPAEDIVTMMERQEVTQADIDALGAAEDLVVADDPLTVQAGPSVSDKAPNDPYAQDGFLWHHEAINTYDAWDVARGAGIVVAVIDSGIAGSHPDLKPNIKAKYSTSGHAINGTEDNSGHGTHVAGIIAAVAGNKKGVAGVAPGAKLISIKALDYTWVEYNGGYRLEAVGTTADVAQAVNLAVAKGANIINMSLGGPPEADDGLLEGFIQDALDKGVLVVVAAGNDGKDLVNDIDITPAEYDGVLTVSATDVNDAFAGYSNYGTDKIDVAAPGGNIQYDTNDTPIDPENGILSTYKAGGYAWMSGTSMATPVVSGVAALVMSSNASYKTKSPDTVAAVTKILKDSANSSVSGFTADKYGAGLVDAAEAVGVVKDATIPDVALSELNKATLKTAANDAVGQYTLEVTPKDGIDGSTYNTGDYVYYYTTNGKTPTLASDKAQNTNEIVIPTNGKKSITIKVAASDRGKLGKVATYTYTLSTSIASATLAAKSGISTVGVGKKLALMATFTPSKPSNTGLTWTTSDPTIATVDTKGVVTGKGTGTTIITATTKVGQPDAPKNFDFEVTVRPATTGFVFENLDDGANFTAITLATVAHNSLPTTLEFVPHALPYENADVADNALQGPGNYTYKSSKPAVATVALSGDESKVVVTPVGAGTTTITVTARDGSGKSAKLTVTVVAPAEIKEIKNTQGQPTQSGGDIEFHVAAGKSINLAAVLKNPSASNKKVTWAGGDPDIATVNTSGKVTAKADATGQNTTITVTPTDGLLAGQTVTIKIFVRAYDAKAKLTSGTTPTLNIIKEYDSPVITYEDTALVVNNPVAGAYDGAYAYAFTNKSPKVVELIDNGDGTFTVKAKAKGKATIVAKAVDGSGKSVNLVVNVVIPVTYLEAQWPFSETVINGVAYDDIQYGFFAYGKSVKIKTYIYPADATNKTLDWTLSDTDNFTIASNGTLKARNTQDAKEGNAGTTISVAAVNGWGPDASTDVVTSNDNGVIWTAPKAIKRLMWCRPQVKNNAWTGEWVLPVTNATSKITLYEEDWPRTPTIKDGFLIYFDNNNYLASSDFQIDYGDDRIYGIDSFTYESDYGTETLYYVYPRSPGTTKLILRALDGSGKTSTLTITVKPGSKK